jgi:hypothetical protein
MATVVNQTTMGSALLGAVLCVGCGSSVEVQSSGAGTTGGGQPVADSYACNVPVDCVIDVGHLGEGITPEAQRCAGKLVASGKKGALKITSSPGPYPSTYETLVLLLGDGKLLRQLRSKCATDDGCGGQNTTAWKREDLERCTVDVNPSDIAGCSTPDGPCAYMGAAKNCTPVAATWTCAELGK